MTDDTAKAILRLTEPVAAAYYKPIVLDGTPMNAVTSVIPIPLADLQSLATLWLLRDDLLDAVGTAVNTGTGEQHHRASALYAKITAIAGE